MSDTFTNKEHNVNTYRWVIDDLITVKQAVTIALVDAGWPKSEARKVSSSLRTTTIVDEEKESQPLTSTRAVRKVRSQKKRGNWTRWTDSERDTLRDLWVNGVSVKEIADRLNRNETQITSALTRYGLYREHSRRPGVQKNLPVVVQQGSISA